MAFRLGFSGAGSAAVAEHLDRSIRDPQQMVRLTQAFPLAVIPYLPNKEDLTRALVRRRLVRGVSLATVALLLLVSHLFWTPLDVLWYAMLRKFGIE